MTTTRTSRGVRSAIYLALACGLLLLGTGLRVAAAPYAALVMDARTGEVLHARNADTRLHPASLTKMMTLYIAFEAVQNGEIGLDDMVTVSRKAAAEVPSKLGLRAGQKIELRYLIRAAAIKSANDAATAIGEAISGSEAAFAARMNRTAQALGMRNTTFRNAHGLTERGHLSTARDMTLLGRALFYHYPQYYNLFSRRSTSAKIATVHHTNRRFLNDYPGADGIKTGFTNAAGFTLTASAERGSKRIIATVFGGNSVASRNAEMVRLMELGFREAPRVARVSAPRRPAHVGETGTRVAAAPAPRAVRASVRPMPRPQPKTVIIAEALGLRADPQPDAAVPDAAASTAPGRTADTGPGTETDGTQTAALDDGIAGAVALAAIAGPEPAPAAGAGERDAETDPLAETIATLAAAAMAPTAPPPRPDDLVPSDAESAETQTAGVVASEADPDLAGRAIRQAQAAAPDVTRVAAAGAARRPAGPDPVPQAARGAGPAPVARAPREITFLRSSPPPAPRPAHLSGRDAPADMPAAAITAAVRAEETRPAVPARDAVVARVSASGGRHWAITLGAYPSRFAAEKVLLRTALAELGALDGALRRVAPSNSGFRANFVGLSAEQAASACARLTARGTPCTPMGPG